jgi:hypothetical protein
MELRAAAKKQLAIAIAFINYFSIAIIGDSWPRRVHYTMYTLKCTMQSPPPPKKKFATPDSEP